MNKPGPKPRDNALVCVMSFAATRAEADRLYAQAARERISLSKLVRRALGLQQPLRTESPKTL